MSRPNPVAWSVADYERAAQEYLQKLPLEHFMEATPQATQRKITLESLDLLHAHRPEVQVFNELLVQYHVNEHLGQVVPDNMVLLSAEPLGSMGSMNLPFESVKPLWTLEYVSPTNPRKDYVDNLRKYEHELKVPYYLLFYPDKQDLRLYHHTGQGYDQVRPNREGRLPLPELDLEVALLNGWVRFWYQGKLLPLPADLQKRLDELEALLKLAERRTRQEAQRAKLQRKRADEEKQRADEEKQRADEEKQRADEEKQRADENARAIEQEKQRAAEAERRAQRQQQRLDKEKQLRAAAEAEAERRVQRQQQRNDKEKQLRAAAEAETARLRAVLEKLQGGKPADE